jgi:lysophospholipase L1-like esterase
LSRWPTGRRQRIGARAGLTAVVALGTVGTAFADAPAPVAPPPPVVVAFGDSVPYAAHCGCPGFVQEYADLAAGNDDARAVVHNYSDPGSLSHDVLEMLHQRKVKRAVAAATTVLMMNGANDFTAPFGEVRDGASESDEYPPAAHRVRANVTKAIERVQDLNPHAHIVVLDYWAAMKDGAVARREYSASAQQASEDATDAVNEALSDAVEQTHVTYVSTLVAFKGPDGSQDPTDLLAADGDHPDAAGHERIAQALIETLPQG